MARLVAATGVVSYNGVTFPPALHSKIQARPVYSIGETTRKYVNYTISVDTVLTYTDPPLSAAVTANQDMGSNSIAYRKYLTEPRRMLTFGGQGFGDFIVNAVPGTAIPAGYRSTKDVAFGPKPRLLVWEPVGSNRAAHVTWTCETGLVECLSNSAKDNHVMLECTHESTFTVNNEGLLTRTLKVTIEIASTVIRGNAFDETVDDYVTRFNPPVIHGFHRETHRHINRDHRVINITYTDTEIGSDNPYSPGMVSIDVSHTVGSTLENDGFTKWMSTMSGSFRWAKDVPRSLAWSAFAELVRQRYVLNVAAPVVPEAGKEKMIKRENWPVSISVTEQLYAREASFTISWIGTIPFEDMFDGTGLFQPVKNATWGAWHASLSKIQSPTGGSGIKEKVTELKIVDVCTGQTTSQERKPQSDSYFNTPEPWFDFGCRNVKDSETWVDAGQPKIKILGESGIVPEFPAIGPPDSTVTSPDPLRTASSSGFDPSSTTKSQASLTDEISYQNRYHKGYIIEVTGSYTRICREPYAPIFESYGDVTLVLISEETEIKKVVGQFFPIYTLTYHYSFFLSRLPKGNTLKLLKTDVGNGDR